MRGVGRNTDEATEHLSLMEMMPEKLLNGARQTDLTFLPVRVILREFYCFVFYRFLTKIFNSDFVFLLS